MTTQPFCSNHKCKFNTVLVADECCFLERELPTGTEHVDRFKYETALQVDIHFCETCHTAIQMVMPQESPQPKIWMPGEKTIVLN